MKEQTDLTICIYHGGFECDLESGAVLSKTTENVGYRICKELDFDILLTGHQHMSVHGRELFGTYTVQPCDNAKEYSIWRSPWQRIKRASGPNCGSQIPQRGLGLQINTVLRKIPCRHGLISQLVIEPCNHAGEKGKNGIVWLTDRRFFKPYPASFFGSNVIVRRSGKMKSQVSAVKWAHAIS